MIGPVCYETKWLSAVFRVHAFGRQKPVELKNKRKYILFASVENLHLLKNKDFIMELTNKDNDL